MIRSPRRRSLLAALALAFTGLAVPVAAPLAAQADPVSPVSQVAVSTYHSQITNDGTNVYYPTNPTGTLPVALLLQGGKVHRMHYAEYAAEVASYGFVVVTPNHRRLNFFSLDYYTSTSQIGETLSWMSTENALATSPLKGHIDTSTLVLLGHSFGGATGLSIAESKCSIPFCTGLTFTLPSQVKAGSFYGTHNEFLGSYANVNNKIPVQLVQGQEDGVAEPAQAETTFSKIQNGPKQIVRLSGANHYGITNTQNPSGADPEVGPQSLSQSQSIDEAARWAALWLRAQLGDAAAATYVTSTGDAADPLVTVTTAP
ncbi:alpha/beta hydrolase family protein [Nocardioides caricicola]|uniref:Alpha/beta hydrolase family protein n=1 Tax=Nocardioides caricicola TaxID=634770 RepID=A0ABW0N460_9ACTN